MSPKHLYLILFLALATYVIRQIYEAEVTPHEDFPIDRQLRVNAESADFFKFLTQEHVLEKLLPWLTRFKEADAKILSVGKVFRAFSKFPILEIGRIHLSVSEFRPTKLLILDSNDSITRQRIEIRCKRYRDRTILRTTVYLRENSILYHYALGGLLRNHIAAHLQRSLPIVAEIYRIVGERRGTQFLM